MAQPSFLTALRITCHFLAKLCGAGASCPRISPVCVHASPLVSFFAVVAHHDPVEVQVPNITGLWSPKPLS